MYVKIILRVGPCAPAQLKSNELMARIQLGLDEIHLQSRVVYHYVIVHVVLYYHNYE